VNILVCVKQVPDTAQIKIDPDTNTLVRAGVAGILNPFDAYALEMAARIKDNLGGAVTCMSMGPEQAASVLRHCLAVGADKAYLVSDRAFGGSDTLATSYVLSAAISHIEKSEGKFDLIFCGKQAIDGDTAQVGPELAEHLDLPQITCAIEADSDGKTVTVKRVTEHGYELIEADLPCVVTVTKPAYEPRLPTIKGKIAAARAQINVLAAADFFVDLSRVGLRGSPTKVLETFVPPAKKGGVMIQEESASAAAKKLYSMLRETKVL